MMNITETGLSAPWETYVKKLKALFGGDPDVTVGDVYKDAECYAVDIVATHAKYDVLAKVLPKSVNFGCVDLALCLHSSDEDADQLAIEEYKTLFAGNGLVKEIKEVEDETGTKHAYIRFWPAVLQFPNDDTRDYRGLWSGLAQDIAREVFCDEYRGIHFGTAGTDEN